MMISEMSTIKIKTEGSLLSELSDKESSISLSYFKSQSTIAKISAVVFIIQSSSIENVIDKLKNLKIFSLERLILEQFAWLPSIHFSHRRHKIV